MDKKKLLQDALNHKEGKVPLDIGSTSITGVHVSVIEKLREYYGLEKRPVKLAEPLQMLGVVEEDLRQAMGIDVIGFGSPTTIFGYDDSAGKMREWKCPWGQTILVPEQFVTSADEIGNTYIYAEGDTNYSPAGKMPKVGTFFDVIIRGNDYDEDDPHVEDNFEEFKPITDRELAVIKQRAEEAKNSPYGVIAAFGGTGFGDAAYFPGGCLKNPKGLRDIATWYAATVSDPEYIHKIFSYQSEIAIENLKKIKEVVGDATQAAVVCGTDFGTQKGPFCSNATFRELYMPYYKKINTWIHDNTSWKTFKHCCGSCMPIIPDLIESGFDILNPIQWSANNMDRKELKEKFGKDLVFWGGGVNTQKTFPMGTPEEVRKEVLETLEIFAKDGGYVCNTIHNIVAYVPVENVVAFVNAVHEFNGDL